MTASKQPLWQPDPAARIVATFQAQRWVGRDADEAMAVYDPRDFDVTERLLSWPLDRLHDLGPYSHTNDEVVPSGWHQHSGPFEIDVKDSLCQFFAVEEILDINQGQLDAARKLFRIGEERDYEVQLTRTAKRSAVIMVRATSREDAENAAREAAGSADFSAENNYEIEIDDVSELNPDLPRHRSPRL